jgi:hypothetical protein
MKRLSVFALMVVVVLCSRLDVRALTHDDFDSHTALWWAEWGNLCYHPKVDSDGNYQLEPDFYVYVDDPLLDGHCKDYGGTKREHRHFMGDYDDPDEGNDYWDYVFCAPTRTTRVGNASAIKNCYAYALATFINKGTYNYWIDNSVDNASHHAFLEDTDSKAKWLTQANDVLYYYEDSHATGVVSVSGFVPSKIKWKYGSSGIYEYEQDTWDTPMCKGISEIEDEPLSGGYWDYDGGGEEPNLYGNAVRRAKP